MLKKMKNEKKEMEAIVFLVAILVLKNKNSSIMKEHITYTKIDRKPSKKILSYFYKMRESR